MQQHTPLRALGAFMLLFSVVGVLHASRATASYVKYFRVKFTQDHGADMKAAFQEAERSYDLYSWNYLLCIWAAEQAWENRFDAEGNQVAVQIAVAARWCDRGLALNPHKGPLRLLKTRLLARESASDALSYWETYVEWHFWDPYNHAVHVGLCADAGYFGKAMQALQWTKRSPKAYAWAKQTLDQAWAKETGQVPPEPSSRLELDYRF